MLPDLLQQQREAENLSDEELLHYAQNGSPHISGLIITQVMADRAQQRQAGAAAAPPSPTVKDQVAQQLASSSQFPGITSIEQPQMATYSGGGIVGYADGGLVGYQHGGYHDPDDPELPNYSFGIQNPDALSPIEYILGSGIHGRRLPTLEDIYEFLGGDQSGPRYHGRSGALIAERRLPTLSGELGISPERAAKALQSKRASGKFGISPDRNYGQRDIDEYLRTMGDDFSYDPIVAEQMEEPDINARFAGIRDMVEGLADPTAGEALRDQQRRDMSEELGERRLRSQELQGMEARSEPWRYAADIAFDREGPTLREGITSVITEREAEQNAISDNMFAMRDAIAEAQAQRERGAVGAAAQLESEIANLGVKTAFDAAKFNASEVNKVAIANLDAAFRTALANNDANAKRLGLLLQASATANPTDLVEVVRAINGTIEQLVGSQSILAGAGREVRIEELVQMLVDMQRHLYGTIGQQVYSSPQNNLSVSVGAQTRE
jgi:hypothetical protein